VLDYGGEYPTLSLVALHRRGTTNERVKQMQLQEIDTLQDLKLWVEENMPGADVYEDMYGTLVIRTGLTSTMGGYLHKSGEEQ
jgi:hypothetical protein